MSITPARIPHQYIVLAGIGQSNVKTPSLGGNETAAYDAALLSCDANHSYQDHDGDVYVAVDHAGDVEAHEPFDIPTTGVANMNIVKYTSLVPPTAFRISFEEAEKKYLRFGSVLESIIAQVDSTKRGERITAGLLLTEVCDSHGNIVGTLASEYQGNKTPLGARNIMLGVVTGMVARRGFGHIKRKLRFGETSITECERFLITPKTWIVSSTTVRAKGACVLAGIGYVSFTQPKRRSKASSTSKRHSQQQ